MLAVVPGTSHSETAGSWPLDGLSAAAALLPSPDIAAGFDVEVLEVLAPADPGSAFPAPCAKGLLSAPEPFPLPDADVVVAEPWPAFADFCAEGLSSAAEALPLPDAVVAVSSAAAALPPLGIASGYLKTGPGPKGWATSAEIAVPVPTTRKAISASNRTQKGRLRWQTHL